MSKNFLLEILIEIHPCLSELSDDDLRNNFVEILESFAAERDVMVWQYAEIDEISYGRKKELNGKK